MSRVMPASAISSQTVTRPSMEQWRDALRTSSQSIVKTTHSSFTDHQRTASIDTGASGSFAANQTKDLPSTVHLNSLDNGSPA
ncbi:hypothetical protein PGT21_033055 [Puccinia graminis f. sp. tritici]|uniref:Uncharacterized protein n=1 Tax=Puccinia graminis f. sp. tritici TaxID=56615 RepID=A0A5B0NCF8_PUCGR|nr:hypothetical protein PGT21_033055 [Puccinia graminis f. sp. tritici]KAA1086383.1 hypothetical protein PGTUg99_021113 [Puccinia graminis f. sp. tritici]